MLTKSNYYAPYIDELPELDGYHRYYSCGQERPDVGQVVRVGGTERRARIRAVGCRFDGLRPGYWVEVAA